MEVATALLTHILAQKKLQVKVTIEGVDLAALLERDSLVLLSRIREILRDDTLDDGECFAKIEALVCLYEEQGLFCGTRHDY